MKKLNFIFLPIIIIIAALTAYFILMPKKVSKILQKELKVIQKSSTTATIIVPIATVPKETKEKKYDVVEGKIDTIPMDTSNPNSPKMTVLTENTHNEVIVLTNVPYTTTLRKLYFEKEVRLKGFWRKNVVIYGREYKSFWIEDYELLKKESKK
jgi:hypothetical protein